MPAPPYTVIRNFEDELQQRQRNQFGSSFRTYDALDYSPIATVDIERKLIDLAISPDDDYIAVCEVCLFTPPPTPFRLPLFLSRA